MKIFSILLLLLFVSFQSGATGYSYNMFVAHKKLQTVKESKKACTTEVKTKKPMKVTVVRATPAQSLTNQLSDKMAKMITLNERIIAEGPSFLFESNEEEETSKSFVSKVSGLLQTGLYHTIGLQLMPKK